MTSSLNLNIFSAPARAVNIPLPGPAPEGGWTWPPTSATLISGEREAILVDTVPGIDDSAELADWIEASGKELTTIFITHAHIDHFLGAAELLKRFPRAHLVATEATARLIAHEAETGQERALYSQIFVDEIGSEVIVPETVIGGRLELEGHDVFAVPTGQSDVSDSSYVHIPELSAVIVGDIAYNDVHPTLVTSTHETRQGWIDTMVKIQELEPEIVVAAHRRADAADTGEALAETIAYVEEADDFLATDPTAEEFIDHMLAAYPHRLNVSTLHYGTAMMGLRKA
ncbi:MBL fold metallo-hydrolase [Arthrobacter sp. ISL-48]|uniref:MBL fold metallo-hydrolase n=1 Tax=Arthrobacter sp. ISL-48 TaxID=2819110 RepID=UPI001BE62C2F|nr:MBL fold metallo-hydrolase [Arthrobacter sp. ISL-48]MBT2534416.1 MBL fold metallo-hydrolase [Arthrobacter sp. ISL-48]